MAKTWRNYKDESRKNNIGENVEEGYRPCDDQIKLGAILRIADAVEMVASSYDVLRIDRDRYRQWHKDGMEYKKVLLHQIAGLKGYIRRLKRRNNA